MRTCVRKGRTYSAVEHIRSLTPRRSAAVWADHPASATAPLPQCSGRGSPSSRSDRRAGEDDLTEHNRDGCTASFREADEEHGTATDRYSGRVGIDWFWGDGDSAPLHAGIGGEQNDVAGGCAAGRDPAKPGRSSRVRGCGAGDSARTFGAGDASGVDLRWLTRSSGRAWPVRI